MILEMCSKTSQRQRKSNRQVQSVHRWREMHPVYFFCFEEIRELSPYFSHNLDYQSGKKNGIVILEVPIS